MWPSVFTSSYSGDIDVSSNVIVSERVDASGALCDVYSWIALNRTVRSARETPC